MSSAPLPAAVSPEQPVPAEFDLLCESCSYSLVGLMTDRCPECGATFDPAQLPLARVPWLYRRRLGKARTHLQTAWFVITSARVFARELCRPVRISESDAHAFRLRTIRIAAAAPIVPVAAGVYLRWPPVLPWWVAVVVGLSCALGWFVIYVGLRLATDLPTFIWSGIPGRTYDLSPLHQYACAPLVLLPIPAMIATAILFALDTYVLERSGELTPLGWLALVLLLLPFVVLMWTIPLVLMRTATGCPPRRVLALAAYLPVHWIMMALLVTMASLAAAFGIAIAAENLMKLL
jgi:hypothetical protein